MSATAAAAWRLAPALLRPIGPSAAAASASLQQRFASGSSGGGGAGSSSSSSSGGPAPAPPAASPPAPARGAPAPVAVEVPLPPANAGPWKRVKDAASGQHYYWNQRTDATTPLGAPRPDAWVGVRTQEGGLYFHNRDDGSTTAVGEPLPGPEGRLATQRPQPVAPGGRSAAFNLVGYPLAVGLGFGVIAGLLRLLF
ncbi:hypothetical protein Rsub_08549 [Raphidocelis subcapitata]|uniref:WW domain-containing protein n=1 Tax=Raphidocelis subcapitata TaxID=307507 RepID=A0A2V0P6T0_9CHLO|nr:hypothetical protein Rsub_08549 [Raphidocelis subcapitata]|eukprot:GBF95568.1 hypothetical protein Rsub_08549 [Raphidocelis subcapitata]